MSSYRRRTATERSMDSGSSARPAIGVHYLRVSSIKQTHTAMDISADGNSIATQREECDRKASDFGATVQEVFIEPGKSAQTIDKRPEFRRLLAYLAEHSEVDYVFVYSRSRAFRNIEDAVLTRKHLRGLGVKIISTKEDFGDTLEAEFMETISDTMNDLQNRRNGEDVKMKMAHKARNGGTIGRAPIGYLNVRKDIDGRQVNTVAVDELRAPLVRAIFELYATGEYALTDLADTAEDIGLRAKPFGRWKAERPLSVNSIHRILGDPYYAGHTVYAGEIFDGRHQPLISQNLYDRVEDVLELRSSPAVHDQKLRHYLKGILFCDRCYQNGRQSRMIYTEVVGNGGRYFYYKCRSAQSGCDLPHLPAQLIEEKVVEHYSNVCLTTDYADELSGALEEAVADLHAAELELAKTLSTELRKLTEQEERLLDAVQDDLLPRERIVERLTSLRQKRSSLSERLGGTTAEIEAGADLLRASIGLTRDPYVLYSRATDEARAHINQAFFVALRIDEHGSVADATLAEPFETISAVHRMWLQLKADEPSNAKERLRLTKALLAGNQPLSPNPTDYPVLGLNSAVMVGLTGFEPATP